MDPVLFVDLEITKGLKDLNLKKEKNAKSSFAFWLFHPKDILQKSLDIGMDGCGETQSFIQ